METEVRINNKSIFYEVFESELDSAYVSWNEIKNPEQKPKTFIIVFSLNFPQDGLSKDCAKALWHSIGKRFILFKNRYSENLEKKFVIRISYNYCGARFECEFDDLLDTEKNTLYYVNKLAEIFPNTKDIRIIRNGPIIINFRSDSKNSR